MQQNYTWIPFTFAIFLNNSFNNQDRNSVPRLDFDGSTKAPSVSSITTLIGFIHNPSQFVEWAKDFSKYKGKNFIHLLPMLINELPDIFSDQDLLRKLNILYIAENIMWIAGNWSADWNKETMNNILEQDLPNSNLQLKQTFFGRILSGMI